MMAIQRFGQIIRLRPEKYEEYKRLHAEPWPEVLECISTGNIRNYSIYHRGGLLFAYFEYVGDDLEADISKALSNPKMQEWLQLTDPCQQPFEGESRSSADGNWWLNMDELFHMD